MKRILRVLWVVYLCAGIGLYVTSGGPDDAATLQMALSGEQCKKSVGLIAVWPLFLNEAGQLRMC
jgi:hypothetical protein